MERKRKQTITIHLRLKYVFEKIDLLFNNVSICLIIMNNNKMNLLPTFYKDNNEAHIQFGECPKRTLQTFGYCIVENVLTQEFCQNTINNMWIWLEKLNTGIDRTNQKTWSNKYWPINLHQGMLQHTLGQEEYIWRVREHKNIKKIFSQIFDTDDLLVSFDGATIARPPETGYTRSSKKSWIHTDQNIIDMRNSDVYSSHHYSVQGVANFETVEDGDSSLLVGAKTHLLHSKLFKYNKKQPKNNWYVLDKKDLLWCEKKGVKFIKVNAPKGSFILFDSRCFHQALPHQKGRKNKSRFRYVSYIAMTPRNRATVKDLAKKVKAIKQGRATSHWSSNKIKIFSYPRTYGKDCPYLKRKENIPDYKNWSKERKKLSGLI